MKQSPKKGGENHEKLTKQSMQKSSNLLMKESKEKFMEMLTQKLSKKLTKDLTEKTMIKCWCHKSKTWIPNRKIN